jgi:SnoaL-like protein
MATFARPRDLVVAFARALNAKDAADLGDLFTDDAEFVNIMGMRMRRREGIVDGHGWAFAGPLRGRRVHFDHVGALGKRELPRPQPPGRPASSGTSSGRGNRRTSTP